MQSKTNKTIFFFCKMFKLSLHDVITKCNACFVDSFQQVVKSLPLRVS